MPQKPSIEETAKKFADQYLWVETTRQNEGWGDDLAHKRAILSEMIKKALEEQVG